MRIFLDINTLYTSTTPSRLRDFDELEKLCKLTCEKQINSYIKYYYACHYDTVMSSSILYKYCMVAMLRQRHLFYRVANSIISAKFFEI